MIFPREDLIYQSLPQGNCQNKRSLKIVGSITSMTPLEDAAAATLVAKNHQHHQNALNNLNDKSMIYQ